MRPFRRRRQSLAPGYAILRSDGMWYHGKSGETTFWRPEIIHAAVFDLEKTAAEKIAQISGYPGCDAFTFEVVTVDREKIYLRG